MTRKQKKQAPPPKVNLGFIQLQMEELQKQIDEMKEIYSLAFRTQAENHDDLKKRMDEWEFSK